MSLYNDLTTVLTPYATKIKQTESDIEDIQDDLEHLDVETDKTLSIEGKPADAKVTGDILSKLTTEKTIQETITNPTVAATAKAIGSNGDIGDNPSELIKIWAFPITGEYTGIVYNVIKGVGIKYIAFYSATTYEGCNASTLVSIEQDVNLEDNNYTFPDGAKICLLNGRNWNSGYLYGVEKILKPDSVVDIESVDGMTEEDQIYRYNDKLYFWDGSEWTEIGSGEDEEMDNILNLLVEDKVIKDEIITPNNVAEYKNIDSNGDIVDQTTYHTYIWAVPITTPCTGIGFNVVKGSGKYLGFYTAETFAECNSSTLIKLINYTNNTDVEYVIPEGTKMCLINYRGDYYGGYLYTIVKVSKADEELSKFKAELNTEIGSKMNVSDLGTFARGRLNTTTGEIISSAWQCTSTEDINIDRTIIYNFDETVYSVTVYYKSSGGTYSTNGGQTTENARTILKGSVVRFNLAKLGSSVKLSDEELVTIPQAITFNTALEDWKEYVDDNCDYESICAKMFEKGGSEKTFANAVGILSAGQSNINGRVPSDSLPSDIVPPFNNIKASINSTNGVFSSSMTLPSKWGVDFSLYDALNKLGQDFYVIKWSEGGTSISPYGTSSYHWTPFYEELDSISHSLLWSFETQIRACMSNNPNTFNPRALIWHQGEGDFSGGSKRAALDYYRNFKCMVAYIRGIVGNERLPIIYGTISHNSGQYCPVVEEAQLKFAQEDPYAYCIDMSGASLIDSYHFDADACVYFGRMAYDALIDFGVITGTKINPTRPWQ